MPGDHIHSCKKHTGSTKAAHETILDAVAYAFLPCVTSTSGRIHGGFLRLLYIIAHRTICWFAKFGDDHPSNEAFKFRRGQYFWHTRAAWRPCYGACDCPTCARGRAHPASLPRATTHRHRFLTSQAAAATLK